MFTFTYLDGISFLLHDKLLLKRIALLLLTGIALLLLSQIVLHYLVVIRKVLTTVVDHIFNGIFHIIRIIVRTVDHFYVYNHTYIYI